VPAGGPTYPDGLATALPNDEAGRFELGAVIGGHAGAASDLGGELPHGDRSARRAQQATPSAAEHLVQTVSARRWRARRPALTEAGLPGHGVGEIDDVGQIEADQPAGSAGDGRHQGQAPRPGRP
jgi:hypothetical protein